MTATPPSLPPFVPDSCCRAWFVAEYQAKYNCNTVAWSVIVLSAVSEFNPPDVSVRDRWIKAEDTCTYTYTYAEPARDNIDVETWALQHVPTSRPTEADGFTVEGCCNSCCVAVWTASYDCGTEQYTVTGPQITSYSPCPTNLVYDRWVPTANSCEMQFFRHQGGVGEGFDCATWIPEFPYPDAPCDAPPECCFSVTCVAQWTAVYDCPNREFKIYGPTLTQRDAWNTGADGALRTWQKVGDYLFFWFDATSQYCSSPWTPEGPTRSPDETDGFTSACAAPYKVYQWVDLYNCCERTWESVQLPVRMYVTYDDTVDGEPGKWNQFSQYAWMWIERKQMNIPGDPWVPSAPVRRPNAEEGFVACPNPWSVHVWEISYDCCGRQAFNPPHKVEQYVTFVDSSYDAKMWTQVDDYTWLWVEKAQIAPGQSFNPAAPTRTPNEAEGFIPCTCYAYAEWTCMYDCNTDQFDIFGPMIYEVDTLDDSKPKGQWIRVAGATGANTSLFKWYDVTPCNNRPQGFPVGPGSTYPGELNGLVRCAAPFVEVMWLSSYSCDTNKFTRSAPRYRLLKELPQDVVANTWVQDMNDTYLFTWNEYDNSGSPVFTEPTREPNEADGLIRCAPKVCVAEWTGVWNCARSEWDTNSDQYELKEVEYSEADYYWENRGSVKGWISVIDEMYAKWYDVYRKTEADPSGMCTDMGFGNCKDASEDVPSWVPNGPNGRKPGGGGGGGSTINVTNEDAEGCGQKGKPKSLPRIEPIVDVSEFTQTQSLQTSQFALGTEENQDNPGITIDSLVGSMRLKEGVPEGFKINKANPGFILNDYIWGDLEATYMDTLAGISNTTNASALWGYDIDQVLFKGPKYEERRERTVEIFGDKFCNIINLELFGVNGENTDRGILYCDIVEGSGTSRSVGLRMYKDEDRTELVCQNLNISPGDNAELTSQNSSGLYGVVTVREYQGDSTPSVTYPPKYVAKLQFLVSKESKITPVGCAELTVPPHHEWHVFYQPRVVNGIRSPHPRGAYAERIYAASEDLSTWLTTRFGIVWPGLSTSAPPA